MSNHVEVVDNAGTLPPTGPELDSGSPRGASVAADVGQHQTSVSTWLTTLLSAQRDPVVGAEHAGNPKVLGLPTFQIEGTAPNRNISQLYLEQANGLPVEVRTPTPVVEASGRQQSQGGQGGGLAHQGSLDFAPIHLTVQNASRGSGAVGSVVQDLQLAQSQSMDPAVLTAAALQAPSALNDSSVLFTGPAVLDRHIPDGVLHTPTARLCSQDLDSGRTLAVDDRTGQVHLLVQDLHSLPNKLALPVKLENSRGMASLHPRGVGGHDVCALPQLGSLVTSMAGRPEMVAGGLDHAHMLQHQAQATQLQQTPKTRWKPNAAQLCLLERHFNSGYTKPTPELYAAVKGAGEAKEAQVSVWLKNRLARSKRQGNKPPQAPESGTMETGTDTRNNASSEGENATPTTGQKRPREEGEVEPWDDFEKMSHAVLSEVTAAMTAIDPAEVSQLAKEVCSARKVCCYGVGRERLVMKALVMRLCHLGLDASMVGEAKTPAVGSGDILLASAGPSYYNTVNAICLAAIRAEARVVAFTAHQTAPLPFADKAVRIPAHPIPSNVAKVPKVEVPNGDADHRIMQLGSAFEVTLWMMFECMCLMIQKKLGVQEAEMLSRHTNLE